MTIYITRGNYSEHAFHGMLEHPEDRHEQVAKLIKAAGGKVLAHYITMGQYDFEVISEFDDTIDGLSSLLVAAGTGGVTNLNTMIAVTTTDVKKAEEKARKLAASFKPAGS